METGELVLTGEGLLAMCCEYEFMVSRQRSTKAMVKTKAYEPAKAA